MIRKMSRVIVAVLISSALSAMILGCGASSGLYPVSGQVIYKGQPAAGAKVSFYRKDGQTPSNAIPQAQADSDGSFQLVSEDLGSGAMPGDYVVLVEWRQGPLRTHRLEARKTLGKSAAREGKTVLTADDQLKGRYFDIGHPRLTAQVKPERNTLPPFDLTD